MPKKKRRKVLPFKTAMQNALVQFLEIEQQLLEEGNLGKIVCIRSDTWAVQVHETPELAVQDYHKVMGGSGSGPPIDVFSFVVGQNALPDLVGDVMKNMSQIHNWPMSGTKH